ncbi:DNA cytosine methyltransferase [Candidatus Viridilinea mediisalina]|uniref:DNA (cytosine-5-)-methyltransferase n=1 Tax=Candidatus Viridilinea mediisalina TaxID=2024553 RepID=A0A2A6RM24_9CHLR|nr:DNA cytosine methyltransferase [Candidatus Viridilinea mediisalina]PDW03951.1 DNA (cytosine-5-)-methyltransferase [Candidatus Viridilinea mediisalina]
MRSPLTFLEFFAGGGLARMGLGPDWSCLFANDISEKKAQVYRQNFPPADELCVLDIAQVTVAQIPDAVSMAWASFPCQDLSVAGNGKGLQAKRSGTFWPFWQLINALAQAGRPVPLIVLENVVGLLTANGGKDFEQLLLTLVEAGYRPGAMMIDAVHFLPHSRPRLFIVALKHGLHEPLAINQAMATGSLWHPKPIHQAFARLPEAVQAAWIWWSLPAPTSTRAQLRELIEENPTDVSWHSADETNRLLALMSPTHLAKVHAAQQCGRRQVGTIYKRVRVENGVRRQRAEVRFDNISGCLRTPVGGSSRQILMVVEGQTIRSRLISVREAARLMGLPDSYWLPARYNDGYHVMGDAVVVSVVSWLEKHLLRPLAYSNGIVALEAGR